LAGRTPPADPTRYRMAAGVEMWQAKDPTDRVRKRLLAEGLADDDWFAELDAEADELATRIRQECQQMPTPPHEAMFDQVYAGEHPLVERERAEFAAYQASFLD